MGQQHQSEEGADSTAPGGKSDHVGAATGEHLAKYIQQQCRPIHMHLLRLGQLFEDGPCFLSGPHPAGGTEVSVLHLPGRTAQRCNCSHTER
jgi:hypothetical protein